MDKKVIAYFIFIFFTSHKSIIHVAQIMFTKNYLWYKILKKFKVFFFLSTLDCATLKHNWFYIDVFRTNKALYNKSYTKSAIKYKFYRKNNKHFKNWIKIQLWMFKNAYNYYFFRELLTWTSIHTHLFGTIYYTKNDINWSQNAVINA